MKAEISSIIFTLGCLLLVNGLRDSNYGGRILNGDFAEPNEFLYVVLLVMPEDVFCGGSIVNEHFVLTAAHCILDMPVSDIQIYPSSYQEEPMPYINVSACFHHDLYHPTDFASDLALVYTIENLVTDCHLAVIPLPPPNTIYEQGTPAIILGWGAMDEDELLNDRLRYGEVVVENWDSCNYEYMHAEHCMGPAICPAIEIPWTSSCVVGVTDEPPSACWGDLGGPVIIQGVIAGVISSAILDDDDCLEGSPTMYTMVSYHLPWIIDIIENVV